MTNTTKEKMSDCCKSTMTVRGDETHYYTCDNCGKPCDVSNNWTTPQQPEGEWEKLITKEVYYVAGRETTREEVESSVNAILHIISKAKEEARRERDNQWRQAIGDLIKVSNENSSQDWYDGLRACKSIQLPDQISQSINKIK